MNSTLMVNKKAVLTGHTGAVYTLERAGESSFYSGGSDRMIVEWDLLTPGEGNLVARSTDIIYSLFKNNSDNLLASGLANGNIHLIDTRSNTEVRNLKFHEAPVFGITFSAKHDLMFSLSGDGDLGITRYSSFELEKKLHIGNFKLRTAALSNEEDMIAVGGGDGKIYVFTLPELKPLQIINAHQEGFSVYALKFSPDDKFLISGARDAHLNVFDVKKNFESYKSIPAHNYSIYALEYNSKGNMFATASRDKSIKIWDAASFDVITRIDKEQYQGHVNSVNNLHWHPETGFLVSTGDDRSVMVWEIND